jgi:hypothetical protein
LSGDKSITAPFVTPFIMHQTDETFGSFLYGSRA